MPCLNEAETLECCIVKARDAMRNAGIAGEVIVADNGSSDGSQAIAESLGARVIEVRRKGYGNALMGGIAAARGKYIIMGDSDASYNFGDIPVFLKQLRAGYELVMGNRFRGGIHPGAMPPLNRYLGNPVLTRIGRLFFKSPCKDFHCGLRGFSKTAYERMALRSTGMEFASEMVVKATLFHMPICEVPTTLAPDGRNRAPHLRPWRDGWRHLRFLLLYSPRWLFLYPGLALMLMGLMVGAWLLPGPRQVGRAVLDVHTLLYAAIAVLLGFQAIAFAVFTKIFAVSEGLHPPDPALDKMFKFITLESGLIFGAALSVAGLGVSLYAVHVWSAAGFGPLDISRTLRLVIPAALCLTLGVQTIFSSFFLSILGLRHR
ncbi:MAG TPA: glycosyltransferase family 2 protein [Candidatus Binatia bacterium]|nr:glycosyltransferase family 2 protein [Candidatus Binatia bacterium]